MCHVTKYSMILGVFQQPWPRVSPTALLNEEKALGTKLVHKTLKFTYLRERTLGTRLVVCLVGEGSYFE